MKQNRRLLYIMNIPSPYRWHLFEKLYEIGANKGVDFQVVFLAKESPRRKWKIKDFPNTFPYYIPGSINLSANSERFLNPGYILGLMRQSWDWIIFGGYDNPTTAILASLPLPRTKVKVIRNEGNLQAHHKYTKGPIAFAKKFVLNRCDAYLVPGQRGVEWLDYWLPHRESQRTHLFPNVIDDQALVAKVSELQLDKHNLRQKFGIGEQKRVFLTPARLHPDKGLLGFIEVLPSQFGQNNSWLIAGDGPLKGEIEKQIALKGLVSSVKLLGYIHHEQMKELYAIADVFVLPSLSDPNPLSVIEAAFTGLPLLVSKRVGNYPELVQERVTGWGFDPANPVEMKEATQKACTSSEVDLKQMSRNVMQEANSFFQSDHVCERLLDFLIELHPDNR